MQQRGSKRGTEVTFVKRDNLFICKEGENDETSPYVVAALSVLFNFNGNT